VFPKALDISLQESMHPKPIPEKKQKVFLAAFSSNSNTVHSSVFYRAIACSYNASGLRGQHFSMRKLQAQSILLALGKHGVNILV